jgi:hypothetical protein
MSIDWSNTCIKDVSYRAMLALFELYIGYIICQHIIRQLELRIDMPH